MAQGVSSYVSFQGTNGYNIRIYFSQTYDTGTKKSIVSLTKIGIQSVHYAGYSTYVDGIIKINGVNVCTLWNNHGVTNLKHSEWYYLTISGSTTVSHSSDGTSTISISVHSNQFSNFRLRSSGGEAYNDGIANGQTKTATLTPIPMFTLSLSQGEGSSISVNRTYSPCGKTGTIAHGAQLWKHDKLKIEFSPEQNFSIASSTVNGSPFVSGNTHIVEGNVSIISTAEPLASQIAATDSYIGSVSTIIITRYNVGYTHEIIYEFGELKGLVAREINETTIAWKIPADFYSQITNVSRGICKLICYTYSNGSLIGSSDCQFTISADEGSCIPTLRGSVVDSDTRTVSLTGNSSILVRYKSDAKCILVATAANGATIASSTINGTPVASVAEHTYVDTDINNFVFVATDSRGYTSSTTVSPTIVPYVRLTLNPTLNRTNPTTGEITLSFSGNYYNGSFGAHHNTLTVRYRYRAAGDAAYGNWNTVPSSSYSVGSSTYSTPSPVTLGSNFSYQQAYVFQIQAYDGAAGIILDTVSVEYPIKKGTPQFDWGENDFAFNVPVNMNSNRISGLLEPEATSDPATKKYVDDVKTNLDGSILEKSNTARDAAISSAKLYVDEIIKGRLEEKLVWENASPSSTFGKSTVNITGSAATPGELVSWKIEYYFIPTNSATTIIQESRYDAAGHRVFAVNYTADGIGIVFRHCVQSGPNFTFEEAKLNGNPTNAMNPVRIWAIYKRV